MRLSVAEEHWFFRVPREQLGYLRFLLEAYDGLAQMRSLPGRAEVEWIVPSSRTDEAARLSDALIEELGLSPIARPGDWPAR